MMISAVEEKINNIKKVLECCSGENGIKDCQQCPAFGQNNRSICRKYYRSALNLINFLDQECDDRANRNLNLQIEKERIIKKLDEALVKNEQLKTKCNLAQYEKYKADFEEVKAEVYKEFEEAQKEKCKQCVGSFTDSQKAKVLNEFVERMELETRGWRNEEGIIEKMNDTLKAMGVTINE